MILIIIAVLAFFLIKTYRDGVRQEYRYLKSDYVYHMKDFINWAQYVFDEKDWEKKKDELINLTPEMLTNRREMVLSLIRIGHFERIKTIEEFEYGYENLLTSHQKMNTAKLKLNQFISRKSFWGLD